MVKTKSYITKSSNPELTNFHKQSIVKFIPSNVGTLENTKVSEKATWLKFNAIFSRNLEKFDEGHNRKVQLLVKQFLVQILTVLVATCLVVFGHFKL